MVNVLVKSTKVPRPIAMANVVDKHRLPYKAKKKVKNQLKEKINAYNEMVDMLQQRGVEEDNATSHLSYAGNTEMPITSELRIVLPGEDAPGGIWPVFRMMVSATFRSYISFPSTVYHLI